MAVLGAIMVPHPPLIVPEVGKGGEHQIDLTRDSYLKAAEKIAELRPDTVIISSPHSVLYSNYFHISPGAGASGSFSAFGSPQVNIRVEYDEELAAAAGKLASRAGVHAGPKGERDSSLDHGTLVPLYFILQKFSDFRVVRTGLSGMDLESHYVLGRAFAQAAEQTGRNIVWVASGDLSHKLQSYGPYGFAPEGPEYDSRLVDVCSRLAFGELLDFDEDFCGRAAECGHRSFVMMAGALDGLALDGGILSHQDVTGVGYGVGIFIPRGADPSRRFLDIRREKKRKESSGKRSGCDAYVRLAWSSIESWVLRGERMRVPDDLPQELTGTQAGAFVSIHKNGELRGCIGTIWPASDTLAGEIINNAVSAAARDPRFDPVRPDELEFLEISVDVLGEPEEVSSVSQLDVRRYGVIVTSGARRGLLLPDLEGVDTPQQQVDIARRKAGIAPWEPVRLSRFEVIRHR